MSLWNKILLVLVGLAALGFFHAAARTLKTYQYWVTLTQNYEHRLDEEAAKKQALLYADKENNLLGDKSSGIYQLQADLRRALALRGRVWEKCDKQQIKTSPAGEVLVTMNTENAVPNRFSDKMMVYVFEEGDEQTNGRYLGEFSVAGVSDKQIVLKYMATPTVRESKQLADSRMPWIIYEMMPTDQHAVFADMPEDRKKAWLPETSVSEYLRDGQPLDASDLKTKEGAAAKDEPKFERKLRDYRELFRVCEVERTLFNDKYECVTRDATYLAAAVKDANEQQQFAEREIAALKVEMAWAKKEQGAVKNHLANLRMMLSNNETAVKRAIADNLKMASEIARIQKEAAQRIEQRSRSMARYGVGAN